VVTAYALPAALVWALLGGGLSLLCLGLLPLAPAALVATALYAAAYGLAEAAGRPRPRPPGTRWQVPQTMVASASRRRRLLVWGSILGPGFATRNPYAGFFLLPLLVAAAGQERSAVPLAAAIGLAHGTGRALALLRDARPAAAAADPLRLVLTSMHWRRLDGITLLVIAAAAAAACASRF
jgi:hypothetical protein